MLYGITDTQLQRLSPVGAECGGEAGNWHTTHQAHHASVEVTPLVASTPAYHVQGRHHCPQMSKGPAPVYLSNVLRYAGQRQTGMRSASAALLISVNWTFLLLIVLEVPRSRTAIDDRSFSIAGP